jgi:hypothetical protein
MRNAFAVDEPGSLEVNDRQKQIVDKLAREVVRRRLTTPALFALEMGRPLNYIGSQALLFFQPIVSVLFDTEGYRDFARFMEHRESVAYLCERIEAVEAEAMTIEKELKQTSSTEDGKHPHDDDRS